MKTENQASRVRRIIGDVLLVLAVLLTADVTIVMLHKINAVVLKADYREIFEYELILCAAFLLFALDVRFNLFTRSKHTIVRIAGWVLRAAVVLSTLVILFFFIFGEGILYISSCIRPNGHRNPHMNLPRNSPNSITVPRT